MLNPLLQTANLPLFGKIKSKHVVPAITEILAENRSALNSLLKQSTFTWQNLLQPLEERHEILHKVWGVVSHLNSVMSCTDLRKAHDACLSAISAYYTELGQNNRLYKAILSIKDSKEYKKLDQAQKKIINNNLRDFKLAGVALSAEKKKKFAKVQQELSQLSSTFSHNVLDATAGWTKLITDKKELAGLPEHIMKYASQSAKQKNKKGWLLTLEQPVFLAIMLHADSRKLRERFYTAFITRASELKPNAGKWDNGPIIDDILERRKKIAKLLGFDNYAELSLVPKMAKNSQQVLRFLNNLAKKSIKQAQGEFHELTKFAREKFNINELQSWDLSYLSEKLRQEKYDISQEELRKYFPENIVVDGLFKLVHKLFGVTIKPVNNIEVWHKDVKAYEVYGKGGNLRSIFYMDIYARPNKQSGAWMNDYQSRSLLANGKLQIPVAFIICNFNPPIDHKQTLLTHDEVETLFHEFGHALQQMLTTVNYSEVAGINGIPWDAVELPSQFMENWCWQKPVINMVGRHYKTGKKLPQKMFTKILAAKNFQSGMQMLRQLEFALFDFRLHSEFDSSVKNQPQKILDEVRNKIAVTPQVKFNRFQNGFSHIFAGGYAAGYYSYKWAEVLSSDAFQKFMEDGLFNKQTGEDFLRNILEPGGSVDPEILYRRFRGRAAKIDALLQLSGIK